MDSPGLFLKELAHMETLPRFTDQKDIVRLQTKTPNAKLAFVIVNYWQNRDGRNCRRWFSVTRPHHHVPP